MTDNYDRLIQSNLDRVYNAAPSDRARAIPAQQQASRLAFKALGQPCTIQPDGISLNNQSLGGPLGVVISLYALYAVKDSEIVTPLKSFKELPNSMPYAPAFKTHCEQILIPRVPDIERQKDRIIDALEGSNALSITSGDFALLVKPLPKISLAYVFYRSDEDFPASATCLFSNNADRFLPVDGLADLGEYTSRTILQML